MIQETLASNPKLPGAKPSAEASSVQALAELQANYESVARSANDFFTLIDHSYMYRAANDAYCEAHRKSRDEIVGHSVAEIWGQSLFENYLKAPMDRCLKGQEVHYQARFQFPTTGLRYFDVSFFPCFQNGSAHIIAVTRDITEKKRAEQELRLILDLTQAINRSENVQTALEFAVRQICEATGWAIGQAWLPVSEAGHLECAGFWFGAHRSLDRFREANLRVHWKPGEGLPGQAWATKQPVWVADIVSQLPSPRAKLARDAGLKAGLAIPVVAEQKVIAVLEFLVSEPQREDERLMWAVAAVAAQIAALFQRKESECALRKSEERLRTLVETANDVIFHLSPDGMITNLNHAFEQLTGWPRQEWLGKSFAPLLHPEDAPLARRWFQAILRGDPPTRNEFRVQNKDGEYGVGEFTLTVEKSSGRVVGTFGFARDVTERRKAEEAVRQSEEHYRELFHQAFLMQENLRRLSNKILEVQEEERTRISRELHDEVGQALTAANVNLAVLMKDLPPEQEALRHKIDETRHRLEELMENVHRFARELRPPLLDDLGLAPALRSISKDFSERTGLHVHLNFADVRTVERLEMGHKTVIYRLVQESLNNIAKHAQAKSVQINLHKANGQVVLEIRDDGKGFSLNKRSSRQAPKRLGLLGMQERVRLVEGTFTLESNPGKGTCVRAEIPLKGR